VSSSKKLFIGGDLNGHIGTTREGLKGYMEVLDMANGIKREKRPNCMDCKVIPGECVVTQHKLLVVDFSFQVCIRRDRDVKITRMNGGSSKRMFLRCSRIKLLQKGHVTKVRM
jgi:hypothetical protein